MMITQKILFLDTLPFNSTIQVGSHKYAKLFNCHNYEVFSLSHFINLYTLVRRKPEDNELIHNWKNGVDISKEGILFYSPFCLLPYINILFFDSIKCAWTCARYCFPSLRKILRQFEFSDVDFIFINNIRLISVLDLIRADKIILRISDRVEAFNNQPKSIILLQREVINKADIVFATSKKLHEEAATINKNSFYLPNGVDSGFIRKPDDIFYLPDDLKEVKKPMIIYVGAISDWFDYETYEYGIESLKDVSFIMIGFISGTSYNINQKIIHNFQNLYKNFYFLGSKPHTALKAYLSFADVGIIPFRVNALTNDINPVKLFEYASHGLPTVSSLMMELKYYNQAVFVYNNKQEYVNMIITALDKKIKMFDELIAFAANNTWEKRFEYMRSKF